MVGGPRMPSCRERENNKRRERRRRAIAAKVFAGLRHYGNYKLPKHCDNNEVLKALCDEAGWTVEPDGTTYRKGCRPAKNMDILGGSASTTPCSSYNPSPVSSYVPNGNSLIPWLRNLSSSTSSSASPSKFPHHYMHGGSISAPVTPPLSSPTTPRMNCDWDSNNNPFAQLGRAGPEHPFLSMSTPPSPGPGPNPKWFEMPQSGPTSPTFSLVSTNPFGFTVEDLSRDGSRMWTPGQSGTCSPAALDIPMVSNEFAFGSNVVGFVKPWEGEMIHSDDLELTLGVSQTR